jgi:hypothetical protein
MDAVTGVVVKQEGHDWLKVSAELVLLLEDQQMAQPYEGKQVRIKGRIDIKLRTLHVESITRLS